MKSRLVVVFVLAFIISACKSDPGGPLSGFSIPAGRGMYILNEGLFQQGNATLSYYDLVNGQVHQDVFARINGRNLGDVGNAIVRRGDLLFIIVNNSHKIEVVSAASCVSQRTIDLPAGTSPRQMAFVNDSVALVTSLANAVVLVVNVRSGAVQQSIPVGGAPDGIAIAGGRAFVANSEYGFGRTVSVIDVASFSVINTMEVGDNPYGVSRISDEIVYVLCAGFYNDFNDPNDDTPAMLYAISVLSALVVDSVFIGGHAFSLATGNNRCYVPAGDTVLVINTLTHTKENPVASGTHYYSVGLDPATGDVILSDARTFTVPGAVHMYAADGTLKRQFDAGIIPTAFAFKE